MLKLGQNLEVALKTNDELVDENENLETEAEKYKERVKVLSKQNKDLEIEVEKYKKQVKALLEEKETLIKGIYVFICKSGDQLQSRI